ncbi:MAG: S8/S53 family peptidase [Acidobacteriota bacterium]
MQRIPFTLLLLLLVPMLGFASPAAAASEAAAAVKWRWIATKADPTLPCPTPGGSWAGVDAFSPAPMHSKLGEYCSYNFTGGRPVTPADIATLKLLVPGQISEIGVDLMSLGSFAPPMPVADSVWQPLAEQFLSQAGPTGLAPVSGHSPVRLAVLDTHPSSDIDPHHLPSNSPHGATLLNMANRALCRDDDEDCIVQLTSRLALTYVSYDPNDPTASVQDFALGGYVGSLLDLAQAIFFEVEAWQASSWSNQQLVLNLSVGWNPTFGGLEADRRSMPLPVRMVYDAIADATCRGAIVVAATGNRTGGPQSSIGPMLPAAWAVRDISRSQGCGGPLDKRLGKRFGPVTLDQPMLYAVAGVEADGDPLTNSRPYSVPERVAFGDHGVVSDTTGIAPTAILTGSSVAALVTSAAAAASWYYAPDLSAEEVMTVLDGAGDQLPITADFCYTSGDDCEPVRRISICPSVASVCSRISTTCPPISCQPWDPSPPDLNDSLANLNPSHELSLTDINQAYTDAEVCSPNTPHYDPSKGPAEDPCPDLQYASVQSTPWVHPQPGTHPCPPCRVHLNQQRLIIEIDPAFTGTLSQPTLDLCGSSYSLGSIPLEPGDTTVVENIDMAGCQAAAVSFTVTENGHTSSAIDSALIVE